MPNIRTVKPPTCRARVCRFRFRANARLFGDFLWRNRLFNDSLGRLRLGQRFGVTAGARVATAVGGHLVL